MPSKKISAIPSEKIDQYQKIIATIPEVELKGAAMPYTSVNGHMFSFLDKEGVLGLRLAREEREEFIKKFKTSFCKAHGTVLKEYVEVPSSLFKDTKKLSPWFKKSFSYVNTLKPKATKK